MNMGERMVHFSDLSGQMIENPEEIIGVVVTEHPDLDQPVRLEAMPHELEQLGKLSIAGVGLEVKGPGDEEPTRHLLTVTNFNKLATGRPMAEVLENAQPVVPPKQQRRSRGEGADERRSHNQRTDGGPLVNYNEPENAGLPHKGKIGEAEAMFVRDNLELVNERRTAAGHAAIDPSNPEHAKRYGFGS
jgi:hypothetical protein